MSTFKELVQKRIQEIKDAGVEPKTWEDIAGAMIGILAMSELCANLVCELLDSLVMSNNEEDTPDAATHKESTDEPDDDEVERLKESLRRRHEFDNADDKRYMQGVPRDRDQQS